MFERLTERFSSLFNRFTGKKTISESDIETILQEVKQSLLEADVSLSVVNNFIQELKTELIGKKLHNSLKPDELLMKIMYDKVVAFLGSTSLPEGWTVQIPAIVMVMGLQGSGKTTTLAKLAYYLQHQALKRGKTRRILMASVDYYRPAAIEQLEIQAKTVGVDFYRSSYTDPVQAAQDIAQYYQKNSYECLLLDTAGRLHIDNDLLHELKAIDQKLKPKYKILVLDGMTGQESLRVAQEFEQSIGFSQVILTKMDSGARGGAAFGFKYVLKKDIVFVGSGEKVADLEVFRAERMASRILGMGDMMTLVERAQEKIKESDSERMYKSIQAGKLSLEDFAQQLEMMGKLGSLSTIMKLMPGLAGQVSDTALNQGEKDLKIFKALLSSMTPKERANHTILNESRKKRIARGAGVADSEMNRFLERFEQTQQFVKMFKKMGRLNPFFNR